MYRFGNKSFNPETGVLTCGKGKQTLRNKTASLLQLFLDHPCHEFTRQMLLERNWQDLHVGDHVLSETIRELRAALGDAARRPRFIKTLPRKGYCWIFEEVQIQAGTSDVPLGSPHQNLPAVTVPTQPRPKVSLFWPGLLLVALLLSVALWWWAREATRGHDLGQAAASEPGASVRQSHRAGIVPLESGKLNRGWYEEGFHELLLVALAGLNDLEFANSRDILDAAKTKMNQSVPEVSGICGALGLTHLLILERANEDQLTRVTYRLYNGVGQILQNGTYTAASTPDAVMVLSGVLAREFGRPGVTLKEIEQLEGRPELQMAFARGAQYASSGLPVRAAEQFQYCLLLDPDFEWARYKLANQKYKMGELDEAEQMLNAVLNASRIPLSLESHVLNSLGALNLQRGAFQEANERFGKAAANFLDRGDWESYLKSLGNQAVALVYLGDNESAIALIKEGVSLAESHGLRSQSAQFLSRLGLIQLMEKSFDPALETLNRARTLYRQIGDLSGVAEVNNNLGAVALEKGEPEKALPYFKLAWQQYEDLGIPGKAALALHNQGTCAMELAQWPLAKQLTETALQQRQRAQDQMGVADGFAQKAVIEAGMGEASASHASFEKAVSIYKQAGREDVAVQQGNRLIKQYLAMDLMAPAARSAALLPEALPGKPSLEVLLLSASAAAEKGDTGRVTKLVERAGAMASPSEWPKRFQHLNAAQ